MKQYLTLVAILLSFNNFANCFFFGPNDWNDLKVTWGINPFGSNNFVSLPRTEAEAKTKGWAKDRDCSTYNGIRYIYNNDNAVMLIFNKKGIIAGISSAIPKNLPFNFPSNQIKPFFNDEGDHYSITAYFTDPDTVCSDSSARLITGDRLIITSKTNRLSIPLTESDVLNTDWTLGQCFYTMGVHYWRNVLGKPVTTDINPDEFFPAFLQYNSGKLNGFGWAFNANLNSTRYEHPTADVLPKFFKQVPKFMSDPTKSGVLSTLHIYLDSTPQLNFC